MGAFALLCYIDYSKQNNSTGWYNHSVYSEKAYQKRMGEKVHERNFIYMVKCKY